MSNCIWYKIWHQYLDGTITAEELNNLTSKQQSIRYEPGENN